MCPPSGFRIVASIASLRKWQLTKIDVKTAFLQAGKAERDVFVLLPTKSSDRGKCLWLLLTAAYGLVNANAKWQVISDQELHEIGFYCSIVLPHLFYLKSHDDDIVAALAKIVDGFLICGACSTIYNVIKSKQKYFTLVTITHRPGLLRYFGLNILQHDDYKVTIDGDDKLNDIETAPLTRMRRLESHERQTNAEQKIFASINSSVGWLCITASPL